MEELISVVGGDDLIVVQVVVLFETAVPVGVPEVGRRDPVGVNVPLCEKLLVAVFGEPADVLLSYGRSVVCVDEGVVLEVPMRIWGIPLGGGGCLF